MIQKKHILRLYEVLKKRLRFTVFLGRFTKERIVFTSIPKSGTNLLFSFFGYLPYYRYQIGRGLRPWLYKQFSSYLKRIKNVKKGMILHGHIPYEKSIVKYLKKKKVKVIFLYRDPRDVVVSTFYYLKSIDKKHKSHEFFSNLKTDTDRIKSIISGKDNFFEPIDKIYNNYIKWLDYPFCYSFKYEDLISFKNGSKNPDLFFEEIKEIFNLKKLNNNILIEYLNSNQSSQTFRKGSSGDWKNFFNKKEKKILQDSLSEILVKLGYEQN